VPLLGINYPVYRMLIIAVGLAVAVGLYLLIERTRIGMLIRAGASNRTMVSALGVNIGWLNTFIFALGAGLAGLAGAMVGPIMSVQPGMGDPILITTLVVIVIGGIGSIRGAFLGALVVGVVDTGAHPGACPAARRAGPRGCQHAGACPVVAGGLRPDGGGAGAQARWPVSGQEPLKVLPMSSLPSTSAAVSPAPTLLGWPKARWRTVFTALLAAFFVLVPVYGLVSGDSYVLILVGRILVFALAAVGLNLALGYGGMVSFGHAMYMGIGAYVVAIASHHGLDNGLAHLLLVLLVTTVVAVPVGLIALRTQGIAFIMITLAFAQMLFFVTVGLKQYGGDEGLSIARLSSFGALTGSKTALYLSVLAALAVALLLLRRVVASRFGLVLRATMINERRVNAVGTPPLGAGWWATWCRRCCARWRASFGQPHPPLPRPPTWPGRCRAS
jgi:branched-chain amino acid transport system permease protein